MSPPPPATAKALLPPPLQTPPYLAFSLSHLPMPFLPPPPRATSPHPVEPCQAPHVPAVLEVLVSDPPCPSYPPPHSPNLALSLTQLNMAVLAPPPPPPT
jgi:hypothetical protein